MAESKEVVQYDKAELRGDLAANRLDLVGELAARRFVDEAKKAEAKKDEKKAEAKKDDKKAEAAKPAADGKGAAAPADKAVRTPVTYDVKLNGRSHRVSVTPVTE